MRPGISSAPKNSAPSKKAQKKAEKNITSDAMKSAMPKRSPTCTGWVWWPSCSASRITSRHQTTMVTSTMTSPSSMTQTIPSCMNSTPPRVSRKAAMAPSSGQGLGSTRW